MIVQNKIYFPYELRNLTIQGDGSDDSMAITLSRKINNSYEQVYSATLTLDSSHCAVVIGFGDLLLKYAIAGICTDFQLEISRQATKEFRVLFCKLGIKNAEEFVQKRLLTSLDGVKRTTIFAKEFPSLYSEDEK